MTIQDMKVESWWWRGRKSIWRPARGGNRRVISNAASFFLNVESRFQHVYLWCSLCWLQESYWYFHVAFGSLCSVKSDYHQFSPKTLEWNTVPSACKNNLFSFLWICPFDISFSKQQNYKLEVTYWKTGEIHVESMTAAKGWLGKIRRSVERTMEGNRSAWVKYNSMQVQTYQGVTYILYEKGWKAFASYSLYCPWYFFQFPWISTRVN